jgi:spermidine synthase
MIVDGWFHERGSLWPGQAMSLQVEEVLYHRRSLYQDILVFRSTTYGNVLVLDGIIQVTERDEFAYQEMLAHVPLYAHPNPKKVLCIGGGDGGVIREIARHPGIEEIVICEIDADVLAVSKQYLPGLAKGYDDPRVTVHIGDGAEYLRQHEGVFDVIVTDSSDPVGPGAVLFETPFYQSLYRALNPDFGIVCTQAECLWLHAELIRPLLTSISQFFTTVEYGYTTIPTYPSGQIGFLMATRGKLPNATGLCAEPRRVPEPAVQAALQYYTPQVHQAAFCLPAFAQRQILQRDDVK